MVRRGLALAAVALGLGATGADAYRDPSHLERRLRRHSLSPAPPYPPGGFPGPAAPLPSGFTMTLVQGAEAVPAAQDEIGKPRDIARRLLGCWSPPVFDGAPAEVTLRLQFSKAGRVIGEPRITYVAAPRDGRDSVVASIRTALQDCVPLRFTASLGAAIAGYPFAIRFIAARRKPADQP